MMKQRQKLCGRLMMLSAALMASVSTYAQTLIEGIYYNFDDNSKEAEVTRDLGGDFLIGSYSGSLTIPMTVKNGDVTYTVTKINGVAFIYSADLTSISIPSTVTDIGEGFTSTCTNLAYITVDKDNKVYDSRENCNAVIHTATNELVAGCKNTKIPYGVTRIGGLAFSGADVSSLEIPNTVTSIGRDAFEFCKGLNSIKLPESLQQMRERVFMWCTNLTSVNIPDGITEIEDYSFQGCENLTSITLPKNLESIGKSAFSTCSSLTEIVIPATVTSVGSLAFEDCGNLQSITFLSATPPVLSDDVFICHDTRNVDLIIHVPKGYKDAYLSDNRFKNCTIIDDAPVPAMTGISTLTSSQPQPTVTYNLEGRRVENPIKGNVYIVNGKKVIY